jgi:hypothetical protein
MRSLLRVMDARRLTRAVRELPAPPFPLTSKTVTGLPYPLPAQGRGSIQRNTLETNRFARWLSVACAPDSDPFPIGSRHCARDYRPVLGKRVGVGCARSSNRLTAGKLRAPTTSAHNNSDRQKPVTIAGECRQTTTLPRRRKAPPYPPNHPGATAPKPGTAIAVPTHAPKGQFHINKFWRPTFRAEQAFGAIAPRHDEKLPVAIPLRPLTWPNSPT